MHGQVSCAPARTAFLRQAERQDVASGIGLAELALWYAHEGVSFDESVAALAQRIGQDDTAVRVAYEFLGFTRLSHSAHTQVMAYFMVGEVRRHLERTGRGHGGIAKRLGRQPGRRRLFSRGAGG
ncbi:MAG TPA: hypothetical protein VFP54_00930 [Acidimicrobiales bacterium]|nr:hypothetical protein [Acidimicrobiales bacterium]